jgi:hypothetical protein
MGTVLAHVFLSHKRTTAQGACPVYGYNGWYPAGARCVLSVLPKLAQKMWAMTSTTVPLDMVCQGTILPPPSALALGVW